MKKLNLFALGLISLSLVSCGGESTEESNEVVTETYNLDLETAVITWTGDYFKGETFDHNHVGIVKFKSGSVEFAEGVVKSGTFVLDMTTLDEPNAPLGEETRQKFVGHIKGEDFFHVEKFPTATVTLSECTKQSVKGTIKVRDIEMPFEAPIMTSVGDGEMKLIGDFQLDFAPLQIPYIGKAGDPEYVSPIVTFNVGLKFRK